MVSVEELVAYLGRGPAGMGRQVEGRSRGQQEQGQDIGEERRSRGEGMRRLCLEELVVEGDSDRDGSLSFPELRALLAPSYRPSRRLCALGRRRLQDGAGTTVRCNGW